MSKLIGNKQFKRNLTKTLKRHSFWVPIAWPGPNWKGMWKHYKHSLLIHHCDMILLDNGKDFTEDFQAKNHVINWYKFFANIRCKEVYRPPILSSNRFLCLPIPESFQTLPYPCQLTRKLVVITTKMDKSLYKNNHTRPFSCNQQPTASPFWDLHNHDKFKSIPSD